MNELTPEHDARQSRSIERAKSVSQALTDAARRARFSSRSRGASLSTTSARRRAGAMRLIRLILLGLIIVVPNVAAFAYYGFTASDQYEAEAKFTVSSGAIPKMDDLGSVSGLPPITLVQDTMIVASYIESQPLVESLQDAIGLRQLYSSKNIDFLSRFDERKPIEKFLTYWNKQTSAAVTVQSGIITLRVRAFSAQDAQRIAATVIAKCDTMVNQLNDRMYRDTVAASEKDLDLAGEMLKTSRVNYEKARNEEGIVDVDQTSTTLNTLLTDLQGQLLKVQSDFTTRSAYLSAQAPQMRMLKEKMSSLKAQIADLQAKTTTTPQDGGDEALSQKLSRFANLELEQKIAEKRYSEASSGLNMARVISERKMLYLHEVVSPALPEEARYPRRLLNIGLIFLGSIFAWIVCINLASVLRNRFS